MAGITLYDEKAETIIHVAAEDPEQLDSYGKNELSKAYRIAKQQDDIASDSLSLSGRIQEAIDRKGT